MTGFLLDTNVPSEMTRSRPSPRVEDWLNAVDDELLYLSVVSLSEILRGVHRLGPGQHQARLEQWLNETLRPWFAGRILPIGQRVAERLGRMAGERDRKGRPLPFADGLIAATALEYDLTIVTRNVSDFAELGVALLNPWDE